MSSSVLAEKVTLTARLPGYSKEVYGNSMCNIWMPMQRYVIHILDAYFQGNLTV